MRYLGTLLLTHSGRKTDLERCSATHFHERYSDPERLKKLPSLEQLKPATENPSYSGSLSFFHISEIREDEYSLIHRGTIKKRGEKIQHASTLDQNTILVAYENGIETWKIKNSIHSLNRAILPDSESIKRYDHPHFSGIHTVFPLYPSRAVISASAPDSAFILNLETGIVEHKFRMPEGIYGSNYPFDENTDLRLHYINNDCQTTHINSAYPMDESCSKLVVSTLIQGAIGIFNIDTGEYFELTRGYTGCHGARVNTDGQIYFADSINGKLIILDSSGNVTREFHVDSVWLHDVQQIQGNIYSFTLADKNKLLVCDIESGKTILEKRYWISPFNMKGPLNTLHKLISATSLWMGDSTQFLSFTPHSAP